MIAETGAAQFAADLLNLKSRLQHGSEKIIDMRLRRIEIQNRNAALQAEVDVFDAWHRV